MCERHDQPLAVYWRPFAVSGISLDARNTAQNGLVEALASARPHHFGCEITGNVGRPVRVCRDGPLEELLQRATSLGANLVRPRGIYQLQAAT